MLRPSDLFRLGGQYGSAKRVDVRCMHACPCSTLRGAAAQRRNLSLDAEMHRTMMDERMSA
jgi:hypothetical protein